MFIAACLFLCVYVALVHSYNQYQLAAGPYNRLNYGHIYGSQPIVIQPSCPYTQQYILQNVHQQPTNSITDLQQSYYLNRILSNPAIQAFIDPTTKIYNQNGVEISDQVRPTTPNVVNNYFIVPSDYLNENVKRKTHINEFNKAYTAAEVEEFGKPNSIITHNSELKSNSNIHKETASYKEHKPRTSNRTRKKKNKSNAPNTERSEISRNSQKIERKTIGDLTSKHVLLEDHADVDKSKNNIKREHMVEDAINVEYEKETKETNSLVKNMKQTDVRIEESEILPNENKAKRKPSDVHEVKTAGTLDKVLFDVSKDCVKVDSRNIRNPVDNKQKNDQNRQSSKNQDNFMKQWMAYIKSFTPMQNFDSNDFTNFNFPYNFEQMYQRSKPPNSGSESNQAPKNRRRKQHRKHKQQTIDDSSRNAKAEPKRTIEFVPAIETESAPVFTEVVKENIESNLDNPIVKSLEATHYVTDVNAEYNQPIIYDIIDYYPDFTKDEVYLSDEDDPYYFFNRHFYETEEYKEQESLKHEGKRDSSIKQADKSKRGNEIPTADVENFKDHRKPVFEELKFQTPPTLVDPGFETRKVNIQDKANRESKANDEKHSPSHRNNVETVFARSKVVKYGQQDAVIEKPKVTDSNQGSRDVRDKPPSNRDRSQNPKDGDTTVVFARSWK